jgi:Sap, sulfolipid-1-addressing protein
MISRPEPRRLLLAFYAGGLIVSVASGLFVLSLFEDGNSALGSTSKAPAPGLSIAAGLISVGLGWLMVSGRGKTRLDDWRKRHPSKRPPKQKDGPSWPERQLNKANALIAFAVGAVINLPGPFYVLALGDIATGGYSNAEQIGLILLFNAIMFVLLEVPLLGYLFAPETTAARVAALSNWLNANGLRVMGALVTVVGLSLIAQGIGAAL